MAEAEASKRRQSGCAPSGRQPTRTGAGGHMGRVCPGLLEYTPPFGGAQQKKEITVKSLILAQDERWLQA